MLFTTVLKFVLVINPALIAQSTNQSTRYAIFIESAVVKVKTVSVMHSFLNLLLSSIISCIIIGEDSGPSVFSQIALEN